MTPERRERVRALFDRAAELPPGERATFLDAACGSDAELRVEVGSLLEYDPGSEAADPNDFLRSPVIRPPADLPATVVPGAAPRPAPLPPRIGPYRVLRELGSGGMGTVYEAEQDNPRRSVALKVIGPGRASPELVHRFAHEAQILGRLHHPGIAQIYEAGVTEEGQPYFAMELIRGVPLDLYVHQRAPDIRARLGLFARVCDAVQHAHDKGVIHRDLKPGNILVDENGQPKVLDFGVARATDADLQTTSGRTQVGQVVGTLAYMSPEQVAADPALIDARADVYALGVILFELLAGRSPYNLAGLPLPEMARIIQDQSPSPLGSINALLRGDVETIVAKALEKERTRRYTSAGELASDIRRHLNHEPIRARPPSAVYLLRKFARRHKTLVAGVVGIMAALVMGMIGTVLFAVRAADQRSQAEINAQAAEHSAQVANDKTRTARRQSYRACLAAAAAALQNHDIADTNRHLAAAPEELRGWEWHHLRSRLDDSSAQIAAPPGSSLHLLRRPNGIEIGAVGPGALRVLDLDGKLIRTVPFGATHERAAHAVQTGDLQLLERDKHDILSKGDKAGTLMLARLSPDGSRLAQAVPGPPGRMNFALYDVATGAQTGPCIGRGALIWDLCFSPDGNRVVSADDAGVASVWNARTGERIRECVGHVSKILSVAFRPDGARLVTASADGTVRQWDPTTGKEIGLPFDRHSGEVLSVAYTPDGQWIASGGADRTIRVWRATERNEVAVLHGHTGAVSELAFTPDGKRLTSLSLDRAGTWEGDNTVRVWDLDFRAGLPVLSGHTRYVYPTAFSPDGRWIASGSWDRTLRLWDARTGEFGAEIKTEDLTRTLAFSPDGSRVVSGRPKRIQPWDVATAERAKGFDVPVAVPLALAYHPDGATLAVLDSEGATVLNASTGTVIATPALELGAAHDTKALAYSPDGRWLAGTARDLKTVCIFDARTYRPVIRLSGHEDVVRTLAFSPDSRTLASCGSDRTIRLWEVPSAKPEGVVAGNTCRILRGHTDVVFALAFHPDGTRLASGGRDRAVWLWDLTTGEDVVKLQGHTSYVWSLDFSPDGGTLVSGSGDKTVRLWDTAPLAKRYEARREAAALWPEAERLVNRLFEEKKEAVAVGAALRADGAISEPLRRAALRELMRRGKK